MSSLQVCIITDVATLGDSELLAVSLAVSTQASQGYFFSFMHHGAAFIVMNAALTPTLYPDVPFIGSMATTVALQKPILDVTEASVIQFLGLTGTV